MIDAGDDAAADKPSVLPAVVRTLAANCSRAHAYAIFTARIGEWWPAAFSASGVDLADAVIEPHVGGRMTLRHSGFLSDDDHGRFESAGGWTEVLSAYKPHAEA